ncbi:nucleoporin autopeptidase-domain-containing protein [Obelidium mucronatum]|nr:nucleoporin autopeptidase-domain-containing protein [Obelidium mucronatum]
MFRFQDPALGNHQRIVQPINIKPTAAVVTGTATTRSVNVGTGTPKYTATVEKEVAGSRYKRVEVGIYQSINAMPSYKNWSPEELRIKDYEMGKKGGMNSIRNHSTGFTPITTTTTTLATKPTVGTFMFQPAMSSQNVSFQSAHSNFENSNARSLTNQAVTPITVFSAMPPQPTFSTGTPQPSTPQPPFSFSTTVSNSIPSASKSEFTMPQTARPPFNFSFADPGAIRQSESSVSQGFIGYQSGYFKDTKSFGPLPQSTSSTAVGNTGGQPGSVTFQIQPTSSTLPATFLFTDTGATRQSESSTSQTSFNFSDYFKDSNSTKSFAPIPQAAFPTDAQGSSITFQMQPTSIEPVSWTPETVSDTSAMQEAIYSTMEDNPYGNHPLFASVLNDTLPQVSNRPMLTPLDHKLDSAPKILSIADSTSMSPFRLPPKNPSGLKLRGALRSPPTISQPHRSRALNPSCVSKSVLLALQESKSDFVDGGSLFSRTREETPLKNGRQQGMTLRSPHPQSTPKQLASQSPPHRNPHSAPKGYVTKPPLETLLTMTDTQLRNISNYTVALAGVGEIQFLEPVDLLQASPNKSRTGIAMIPGTIVLLQHRMVQVYPDEYEKDDFGYGLNVPALVSLERCWAMDQGRCGAVVVSDELDPIFQRHFKRLESVSGTTLVAFNKISGVWKFRVEGF